ncbi:protein containing DUF497 [Beggiatoa sp. PS]|nr:protein containing DUF497 [Beggiatoa sp. PS]
MSYLKFVWDENKNRLNQKKHKVSFEEAKTVFFDENARLIPDPDHSETEERFILLGLSVQFRILLVSHCYRENDSVIRIISARKANRQEQQQYI